MSAGTPPAKPPPEPTAAPDAKPASRPPPGSLRDRIGLAICWSLGLLFCAIAAAIVIYLLIQGIKYVRPELLRPRPEDRLQPGRDGRVPRPAGRDLHRRDDRDRDRAAARRRDRRLAERVRAALRPRPDRGVDRRDDRRHPVDRSRPVRHRDLLEHRRSASSAASRAGSSSAARSSPPGSCSRSSPCRWS